MGGASGQASELEITVREIMKIKNELYAIISHHTGKPVEQVEKDADRDYWMNAEEAVKYGMIDEVLVRNKK
jgi:ATP-dependent Clp protease, protease subunit